MKLYAALLVLFPLTAQILYEEDPGASRGWREKNWREMQQYVQTLVEAAKNRGPLEADYRTPDAYRRSVEPVRRAVESRLGYPPPGFPSAKPEMKLERAGEDDLAVYWRSTVEAAPGLETYGLYLVPKRAKQPAPLVIAQHGGGGYPELALFRGGTNYNDLVRGPLRRGWVVYAPLAVMYPYGDRDRGTPIPENGNEILNDQLRARGTTRVAVEIHKLRRALEAVLARPEVDARKVAMAGLSFGGLLTTYVMAVEPRITAGVASCAMRLPAEPGSRADLAAWRTPNRSTFLPLDEVMALIAPRPFQVQSGIDDPMPIADARTLAARGRLYWAGLGAEDRFAFEAFAGKHEFNGELAWAFLARFLEPAPTVSGKPPRAPVRR